MSPQGEQAKLYILGGAAVVGGITLGWAASQGWLEQSLFDEGDDVFRREPTTAESVGAWIAFNTGVVLLGAGVIDVVKEYGAAKVAGIGLGIPAAALLVRALRS